MAIDKEQVYSLLLRRRDFKRDVESLQQAIEGSDTCFESVVWPGRSYFDKNARRVVKDILEAYDICRLAEYAQADDAFSIADFEQGLEEQASLDEVQLMHEKGAPDTLSPDQRKFLGAALYCLLRLMTGPRLLSFSLFGGLAEVAEEVMEAFGKGLSADRLRAESVARDAFAGGVAEPMTPERYAAERDASRLPLIGFAYSTYAQLSPAYFLQEFDEVYELLSGKPVSASLTKQERAHALNHPEHFAFLKEDQFLDELNEDEARIAREAGWLNDADIQRHAHLAEEQRRIEAIYKEDYPFGSWHGTPLTEEEAERLHAEEERSNAEEAAQIRDWVASFPEKDYWCKQYLLMRKTFMKLDGLGPTQEGFDEDAWADPLPIDPRTVAFAVEAVREAYGLSHYTSRAFVRACERIHRTAVDVRYDTRQEARRA